MKKLFLLLFLFPVTLFNVTAQDEQPVVNPWAVELARNFGRDIFESNGVPYVKPMVEAVNATSNSRFFNSAFVPSDNKFYFRFGLHFMWGLVRDDMTWYKPTVPNEAFDYGKAAEFADIDVFNQKVIINDTAGLIHYMFKTLLYDGLQKGSLKLPERAATVLGDKDTVIVLDNEALKQLAREHPVWQFIPEDIRDTILGAIGDVPSHNTLPSGGNISSIFAGVPQLEIGSLYGTEMLIRYIPKINMGSDIGDFTFWGIGLKHSISQYFRKPDKEAPFELAIQGVYQGTQLTNVVGFTKALMESEATFWNFNIHASKKIKNWFEVYSGIAYESIDIKTSYTFTLPVEQQWELGLLEPGKFEPTPGYPGDTEPQTAYLGIDDQNFKFIIGINKRIWDFEIFADYNISQFNIFTGGIKYIFN